MKINYDKSALTGKYDKRNLTICKCGKHTYPSKKMFIEFLKQFKDVDANVDIWSLQNIDKGKVQLNVELEYKVAD